MADAPLRFHILGAVRAWRGDDELDLGPTQQRNLLAVLLAHAGRPVSAADLTGLLWRDDAPASALNLIHRYVGGLRRLFEPGLASRQEGSVLERTPSGYRMNVTADSLDLLRFRSLAGRARAETRRDPAADATGLYLEALAPWQGRCVDAVQGESAATPLLSAIDAEYDAVLREAADEALRHGSASLVAPLLRTAAAREPLDEGLQARLMLSHAALGRQADALQVYQVVRSRLADELGVSPSEELRAAHRRVLAQPAPAAAAASNPQATGIERTPQIAAAPPAQLPADLPSFVGRRAELAALWDMLPAPGGSEPTVVLAIDGLPGAGKTALAVHWAHQAKERFPDGQLYLDLRGFDAEGLRVSPSTAVLRLLGSLGLAAERVPDQLDARSALLRSLLTSRRVLIVLDNARDADQVRPLLPGAGGCCVVVTSRRLLVDLVVREGVRPLTLGLLDDEDAYALLASRIGTWRAAAEPEAARRLVERCGRLPLALALVAARAAARPDRPLSEISDGITAAEAGLDLFDEGDIRAVFSWSYRVLSDQAAMVLRYSALFRGADIPLPAVANLVGMPLEKVRRPLVELVQNRLITEHAPGRFLVHDLIRLYAGELGGRVDPAAERGRAVRRLAAWYLGGAAAAQRWLLPSFGTLSPVEAELSCPAPLFSGYAQALAWCDAERGNFTAVAAAAMDHRLDDIADQLPSSLWGYCHLRRTYDDWAAMLHSAMQAARRRGNRAGEAVHLGNLGTVSLRRGRNQEAIAHYEAASELFQGVGDARQAATALSNRGLALHEFGRPEEAAVSLRRAVAIDRAAGDCPGLAFALLNLGVCLVDLDEFDEAERCEQEALGLFRELADRAMESHALANLGAARLRRGDFAAAGALLGEAARLMGELEDEHGRAVVLCDLAEARAALGEAAQAAALRREAWAVFARLGDAPRQRALETLIEG